MSEDKDNKDQHIIFLHVPHTSGRVLKSWLILKGLFNKKVSVPHSCLDFEKILKDKPLTQNQLQLYFVLRDPIKRLISEYIHYSGLLKKFPRVYDLGLTEIVRFKGQIDLSDAYKTTKVKRLTQEVGNLNMNWILKRVPTFNINNPFHYFSLEETKNQYCKYILLRTDFSIPITNKDYELIQEKLRSGYVHYDMIGQVFTLAKLTGFNTHNCLTFVDELHHYVNQTSGFTHSFDQNQTPYFPRSIVKYRKAKKEELLKNKRLTDFIKANNFFDQKLFEEFRVQDNNKKVVFLHVPHTSGRNIISWVVGKNIMHKDFFYAHNDRDMTKLASKNILNHKNGVSFYFILRNPVARAISEYSHYREEYKKFNGIIGFIYRRRIQETFPDFNMNDPVHYFKQLEDTKNLYCKFLLKRQDFRIPITKNDFQKVLQTIKMENFIYDRLGSYKNLARLLNVEEDVLTNQLDELRENYPEFYYVTKMEDTRSKLSNDEEIKEMIRKNNQWDIKLYEHLMNNSQ